MKLLLVCVCVGVPGLENNVGLTFGKEWKASFCLSFHFLLPISSWTSLRISETISPSSPHSPPVTTPFCPNTSQIFSQPIVFGELSTLSAYMPLPPILWQISTPPEPTWAHCSIQWRLCLQDSQSTGCLLGSHDLPFSGFPSTRCCGLPSLLLLPRSSCWHSWGLLSFHSSLSNSVKVFWLMMPNLISTSQLCSQTPGSHLPSGTFAGVYTGPSYPAHPRELSFFLHLL